MKFAHSLDDSLLVPVFGMVAAALAAATAMFGGSVVDDGHEPPDMDYVVPSVAPAHYDVMGRFDTGTVSVPLPEARIDHHAYMVVHEDAGTLSEHVLDSEPDVDELNEQLDTVVRDLKSSRGQRRR